MNNQRHSINSIYIAIIYLICQTSSFDVILNLRLGGFSLRITYALMLLLFAIYVLSMNINEKVPIKMLGLNPFVIWMLFLIVFIINTPLLFRNIGYIVWLGIHFVFTLVLPIVLYTEDNFQKVFKLYIISFLICSVEGIIQLILGWVGIDFFVATEQWLIPNKWPRLNGFTYEPSYFATYLIIGFSICYCLYRNHYIYHKRLVKSTLVLTGVTLMLSSSRMGILVMILQILALEIYKNRSDIKNILKFAIPFVFFVVSIFLIILNSENLFFLLDGLGFNGGAAHSSLQRLDGFFTQLEVLLRNPFKGYSLGGVSQIIAFEKGETNLSQETIKPYDNSINIFMEVLTASGIIGYVFFIWFIYSLVYKPLTLSNLISFNDKKILQAFVWALLFEFVILCFNQNILRAYLWIHIALLNYCYFYMKEKYVI